MNTPRALQLVNQLAEQEGRQQRAQLLARELGAEHLLLFLEDREVRALLPAPGFALTLPGGPGWVELLERCRPPGRHQGTVCYPDLKTRIEASALSLECGLVLVLIGGSPITFEPDALGLPLLSAVMRAEARASAARGHLIAEREEARHATALAAALDKARRDLEDALAGSAHLNAALQVAAKERAELLESERAANQAKDEFLAMLEHELRNPLAPMATALQLIRLRGDTTSLREHEVLERQTKHLTHLVDDLLDVARIARGKVQLHKVVTELAPVVAKAVELASPLLEGHRHHLTVDVPSEGLLVDADEHRLAQVLSNLLTNAARYTPAGGHICVSTRRDDGHIVISVRDDGIGIEPSNLTNVFELFVQGARSKDRGEGGLGLGLSIVKNLVLLHGGEVSAHSEGKGRGTELLVRLPSASPEQAAADVAVAHPEESVDAGGTGMRVLVVDDNVDAAELLGEALGYHGYDVEVCHDGLQALERSKSFQPEVAILDIGLPVMDGLELARRLRALTGLSKLKLIAATGYGQESDRTLTREAGFDHHLVKPLRLPEVVSLLTPNQSAVLL